MIDVILFLAATGAVGAIWPSDLSGSLLSYLPRYLPGYLQGYLSLHRRRIRNPRILIRIASSHTLTKENDNRFEPDIETPFEAKR